MLTFQSPRRPQRMPARGIGLTKARHTLAASMFFLFASLAAFAVSVPLSYTLPVQSFRQADETLNFVAYRPQSLRQVRREGLTALSATARPLPRVPPIFPVANVTEKSKPKALAGWISGTFANNTNLLALDMVRVNGSNNSLFLYSIAFASVDKSQQLAAQIMPRQRDNRFRLRLLRGFPIEEDDHPELFTVAKDTDHQKLAWAMRSVLRPGTGDNRNKASTLQIRLVGIEAASQALLALEELYWRIRREISFTVAFEGRSIDADEALSAGKDVQRTQLVISVTSS